MSGTVIRKILTILIVAILARIPFPWVHSHADMAPIQLSSHIASMHSGQLASDLPTGWHVHLLILGPGSSSGSENGFPKDPLNGQNTTDNFTFCDTELDTETISEIATRVVANSQTLIQHVHDIQAQFALTQKRVQDQSRCYAEPGQWGYAPSVLLI